MTDTQISLPRPTSEWQHDNGNVYIVLCIANEFTEQPDRYPQTVVYMGLNGRPWSRPASDWHRSMTPVRDAVDTPAVPAQEPSFDPARPVSAANLPESMKITQPAAETFLSKWRAVIGQLQVSRSDDSLLAPAEPTHARPNGQVRGLIVGEPDGESE
jgi:hypothetical protein